MTLYQGDCLEIMPQLPAQSVDAIITDLPYGTTACKWDSVIPFAPMWEAVKHVLKPRGAFVTTASQPFTSALIMSNVEWFKYNLIYKKSKSTGFLDAKRRPLNNYEDIPVFCEGATVYNPQMTKAMQIYKRGFVERKKSDCYGDEKDFIQFDNGQRYPNRIIEINNADTSGIVHPTQKPVALYEYLIKTYTNAGDTVLDMTMGSGTTGVACANTGREFIGIERDADYFAIAEKRIAEAQKQMKLFEAV